ncbi:amino acid adenylation domain-containing protein [Bacillus spizizenii]|nr:amino acid adenylation domain-containing protein [Bacillus spizizenii]
MDDISIINQYVLEQVKEKKMDREMALRILKGLTDKSKKDQNDIAIIGISCRFSKANNVKEYWNNILHRVSCIREFPSQRRKDVDPLLQQINENSYFKAGFLDEIDKFDSAFFRISPREAKLMDPKQRLFLETAYHAFEDSGYSGEKLQGSDTGIFVGHDHSGDLKFSYASLVKDADMIAMTGTYPGILASRTSYIFNLKGPSLVVDTACSSGLVSVHLACEALKNKECSMALAGGVNLFLRPENIGTMNEIEAENAKISVFDKDAKGTAWGEGISAIVLKPLNKAIEDQDHIYAVIKGSAINNDGASNGITAPNAESQEKLITHAWKNAKINPETISYIEAHGTGTILGDPIEIKGITNAFKKHTDKKQFCGIGSVKPNIGHTVGASGMASLIKACMALKEKVIPPSINFNEPNPLINFLNSPVYINDSVREWKKSEAPRRAGVSSFGFSGTNCHLVLEEAPEIKNDSASTHVKELFTLSAKNIEVLRDLAENYHCFITEEHDLKLSSLCYTANTGRKHWEYRICFMVKDIEELKTKIKKFLSHSIDLDGKKLSYREERELKMVANQKIDAYKNSGNADEALLTEISSLYERGVDFNWDNLYEGDRRRKVSLPGYTFVRERHWIDIPKTSPMNTANYIVSKRKQEKIRLYGREGDNYSKAEKLIGQVWGSALGINPISISKDFYDMGGDSIIAIEIINSLNEELNTNFSVADLFNQPNIEAFSSYIEHEFNKNQPGSGLIPKLKKSNYYEASSAQKRIFILDQLNKNRTTYNIPFFFMIEGELDEYRLETAFHKLIRRHEVLRTSFGFKDGQLVQMIEEDADFKLERFNANEPELERLMAEFVRPFDLGKAPLLRAGLVKVNRHKHLLMVDIQHIIADGASVPILQKELIHLYEGNDLPKLNIQYKDFAKWQNEHFTSEEMKKQKQYWVNEFKDDLPILDLPLDFSRDSERDEQGERIYFYAGEELTSKLKQYNSKEKVTLFMTLMASFNVFLYKHTGQEDIIIGSPIAGRKHKELENMIGMFVNTLAIRNNPDANKTFKSLLEEVRVKALKAYENQDYPFEELVDHLEIERDINRNALFNVMFVLQLMDSPTIEVNQLKYTPYPYENKTAKFDLLLQAFPSEEDIKFEFTYSSKLFKRETIEKFSERFLMILKQIVLDKNVLIGDINIIDHNEWREIADYSHNVLSDNKNPNSICEVFEKQAELNPQQIAVAGQDGALTYKELNEKTNQLARALIKMKVKQEEVIGILTDRSTTFVFAMMGILKAGAAYLPIDSSYPKERVQHMLKESGARFLIVDRNNHYKNEGIQTIYLDELETASEKKTNLRGRTKPHNLAYVIFTSGSTGMPKGVMIEHKSIVNLTEALYHNIYHMHGPKQNVALLAPFVFDASVKQIFSALLLGHSLFIIPEDVRRDVPKLTEYYIENNIDICDGTPAYISLLSEYSMCGCVGVKHFIIGGETLLSEEIKRFYKNFKSEERPYITNVYGPTECCVDATAYTIDPKKIGYIKEVPIGRPLKNCSVHILDQQLKPVPKGVIGEIYIGGTGVGRGYCNQKELSNAKFVQDLFYPGEKMYKTGDLGKWMSDGNIQFAGRIDRQVKVRGYRIELDEITNTILSHSGVQEAAVTFSNDHIVAYIVSKDKELSSYLKEYLKEYLPDYMLPSAILSVNEIPKTNNGKIDLKRLPEPYEEANLEGFIAPRNHIERVISGVWSDILEKSQVGIRDNFFALGGDSIKAIQAAARMDKYNMKLEVKDIFQYQTIEGIAKRVKVGTEAADNSLITSSAELVPIQSLLVERHKDTLHHRNLSFVLYREDGFGEKNVKKIFTSIVQHHDALRMIFKNKENKIVQENRGLEGELFDFHLINATQLSKTELKLKINQIQESMDLSKGPLVKVALIKADDGEHLLIVIHQMIIDHVSWRIILEDFNTAFNQLKNNENITFSNKTDSFISWARYLHQIADDREIHSEKEYWRKIESVNNPSFPTDFQPETIKVKDNHIIYRQFSVEETESIIRAVDSNKQLGIESIFLTALGLTMKSWTGSDEIVVHLGSHGRTSKDLNIYRTVGRFSSIYPVALNLSDSGDMYMCLTEINKGLKNIPNQGIGYGILRYLSKHKGNVEFNLNPEISFNYMGEFDHDLNTENFTISPLSAEKDISDEEEWKYKFKVTALIREGKVCLMLEYNQNQYRVSTVEVLLDQYMTYIKKASENVKVVNENNSWGLTK